MGSKYIDRGKGFPEFLAPILGFLLFTYKPFFSWNFGWRFAFILGVIGFTLGMFTDRCCRGSY